MNIEKKLEEMGIDLPDFGSTTFPGTSYGKIKPYHLVGNVLQLAGHIPVLDGEIVHPGRLGATLTTEQGYEAARITGINVLAGFKKALDAGVPIANGSDLALPDGALLELGQLVRRGMTEWQAIVAATKTSAEVCLVGDERGTIETGKAADLLAVGANPLDDIENVRDVKLVVKDGTVVVQR